nr:putative zinc finger, SWIM-type [Tanacetum cinerariifolium]
MSPGSVKTMFNELDDDLKKAATTKFDIDNACDSEEFDIEDEVDDSHDYSDPGNVFIDEDNIIDECDIDVSLFKVSKSVDLGTYRSCSMRENDLDVIDNNEFKSDMDYVQKKKLKEYRKQLMVKEDGKANSDVLLNNMCEVFNGRIVGGTHKPIITGLEYVEEYCMKRIVNVENVIAKNDMLVFYKCHLTLLC